MSVFYPMSKDRKIEDSNKKEFWDYPKNNIQCRRMFRANAWIMGVKWEYPEFISTAALNLKLDVENNGPLSSDFDKGKKKLIPIVFSHGIIAARALYGTHFRELAS